MFKAVRIAALGLLISSTAYAADQGAPAYQPFPAGYGYMDANEIAKLQAAWKDGNRAVTREHAWRLWAGIMQRATDTNWPVWFTWPNSTAAFLPAATAALGATQAEARSAGSLLQRNKLNMTTPVNVKEVPNYPIPTPVLNAFPGATTKCLPDGLICDGSHFQFNGDILIPTESLSKEGYDWIRGNQLYSRETLDKDHSDHTQLAAPQRHIVTKHMFWPVKAGQISALPVWHSKHFNENYPGYAGYENWPDLVAIDPTGRNVGKTVQVSYLHGVYPYDKKKPDPPLPTISASAKVYGLKDFYYHEVTAEDWNSFDEADKAILNAASNWAYDQPFGVGDFLVTIAMHVNTKEIPTWTMQSVWWSDEPNAKPYAANRPRMAQAKGPWDHYLLVDSFGGPNPNVDQPVAMNPYIELAIHPIATNCNNCHNRAGWPHGKGDDQASYQNKGCMSLLATLSPKSDCLAGLTLTDFQWLIPDRAISTGQK
jgi:hypothetical protein